jgi:hypothetical protein
MTADREAVVEVFRQILQGSDIPAPASLLRDITAQKAAIQLPDMPYSILINLAHTDFWQQVWIDRLEGRRAKSFTLDWKSPPEAEWPNVRASFLDNLDKAMAIASGEPFQHRMKSDAVATKTLLQIAVHDAYHIGQINLLKRALRLSR